MKPISIVIICRNEAHSIGKVLGSLSGITDDVIVYDNGSTDGTLDEVRKYPVNLHQGSWEGFGQTKRKANALARYDWILSLDADESISAELKSSLLNLDPGDPHIVYDIPFRNYLGDKPLRYGEWGRDHHIRLFNKTVVNWDNAPVHEELVLPERVIVKKIRGLILHQTMRDIHDYGKKMIEYAMLNADKYHQRGRKASWFRIHLYPGFKFIHYYYFRLGFLDGQAGYICARMTAYYTFMKYARLRELNQRKPDTKEIQNR